MNRVRGQAPRVALAAERDVIDAGGNAGQAVKAAVPAGGRGSAARGAATWRTASAARRPCSARCSGGGTGINAASNKPWPAVAVTGARPSSLNPRSDPPEVIIVGENAGTHLPLSLPPSRCIPLQKHNAGGAGRSGCDAASGMRIPPLVPRGYR